MEYTTTVVAYVSYFSCDDCAKYWEHEGPQVRRFMACDKCGIECESYESEEVDGG